MMTPDLGSKVDGISKEQSREPVKDKLRRDFLYEVNIGGAGEYHQLHEGEQTRIRIKGYELSATPVLLNKGDKFFVGVSYGNKAIFYNVPDEPMRDLKTWSDWDDFIIKLCKITTMIGYSRKLEVYPLWEWVGELWPWKAESNSLPSYIATAYDMATGRKPATRVLQKKQEWVDGCVKRVIGDQAIAPSREIIDSIIENLHKQKLISDAILGPESVHKQFLEKYASFF